MKKFLALALGLGLVFAVANTSEATNPSDLGDNAIAGGIVGSRHNLGAWGVHFVADNSDSNGGTSEVCIWCHTPHHGSTTAPLWNKGTQTNTGDYIGYGTTIAGTSADTTPGAASLACLSCHDGVNTIDTLVNAPGKGNDGSNNSTRTDFNWTFTEDGNTVNDSLGSTRLNLGTDLSNDHPISITYVANNASLRATSVVISTLDMSTTSMTAGDGSDDHSSTTITNRWSVKGYINPGATISDLLRSGKVECSSCHDPHFSNKTWDETESAWGGESDSDGLFLRRVGGNSLSGVCRTCHDK